MKFSKLGLFVGVTIVAVLLLALAVLVPIFLNNLKLNRFAGQLDKVEEVFARRYQIIAEGRQIYVAGNDAGCTYRVTRVYRYLSKDKQALTSKLNALQFENADVVVNAKPETTLSVADTFVLVSIQSGPFGAGFDIRCF